jgi:hypothetical protein
MLATLDAAQAELKQAPSSVRSGKICKILA